MWRRWKGLRAAGVIGLNERNRDYVMRLNERANFPLVDDKLATKKLAIAAGLRVPELYGTVQFSGELSRLDRLLAHHSSFVIKPAHGSGGGGVLVIDSRRSGYYVKPDGRALSLDDLEFFVSNILSGVYSLGGLPDTAMIEYRVRPDPLFDAISYRGVPDIRLLVYRGIPAVAMLRLPTRASDGKANLHQGAVGVGIDIASGVTTAGVSRNRTIEEHPDFGSGLAGYVIPGWEELLAIGTRCADLCGLGYCGVDLVLDETQGPMMLEVNARPGLAIQIANRRGLKPLLAAIDAHGPLPTSVADRVALARALSEAVHPVPRAEALEAPPAAPAGA